MRLGSREIVLTARAAAALAELEGRKDPEAASITKRIRAFKHILLDDCLHGEVVGKGRIPRLLRERYGLQNLYVEDLPSFWRMLYTVVRDGGSRYIVIIEIVDHRTYSRWFPGR